jgi:hypothetical protein
MRPKKRPPGNSAYSQYQYYNIAGILPFIIGIKGGGQNLLLDNQYGTLDVRLLFPFVSCTVGSNLLRAAVSTVHKV